MAALAAATPGNFTAEQEGPGVLRTVALGSLFGILILVSVCGNFLVCIAVLLDRKLRKQENLFLVSLAIADILVASSVMTFAASNDILGYWTFGVTFCTIWLSCDVMCCTASILNLCAISFDRYWHIRNPISYSSTMTQRKIVVTTVWIWVLSISISFVPIHLQWHQIGFDTALTPTLITDIGYPIVGGSSDRVHCELTFSPHYAVASSIISFFLPSLIMTAAYGRMYWSARKHMRVMREQFKSVEALIFIGTSVAFSARRQTDMYNDQKAKTTVAIIVGVFMLCWCPFFVVNVVRSFCPNCVPTSLFQSLTWLGYANSSLNPVLYSVFSREFRGAFRRVLACDFTAWQRSYSPYRQVLLGDTDSRRTQSFSGRYSYNAMSPVRTFL